MQEQLAAESAEWFARLQDADEASSLKADFVQWVLRSPEHLEEFLAVSRIWGETRVASTTRYSAEALIEAARTQAKPVNVVPLHTASALVGESSRARSRKAGRFTPKLYSVASIAAAMLSVLSWLAVDRWFNPALIRTAIGEQRSVTLSDGSVMNVNTHSKIRLDFSKTQRRVRLVHGEARFKVMHDPRRPFIVTTREASIRALGTVFNVRAESRQTAVAVLEGEVELRQLVAAVPARYEVARIELTAGQQAAVNPAGHILPDTGPPLERVAAWTERRLVFREEPLAEVVAEFNRYHKRPIRIEAPELADLRISGTFDASDPNSFLEYFARFERVQVERDADSIRLRLPTRR